MFNEDYMNNYGENLSRFMECVRRDLKAPKLPFFVGELCTKTIWGMDLRPRMYAISVGQKEASLGTITRPISPRRTLVWRLVAAWDFITTTGPSVNSNTASTTPPTSDRSNVTRLPNEPSVLGHPKGSTIQLVVGRSSQYGR